MKKLLPILFAFSTTVSFSQLDSNAFRGAPATGPFSDQYINTPISTSLNFTEDFTIECWIFLTSSSGQEIYLIESYSGAPGGYVLRLSQSRKVRAYAMGSSQATTDGATTVSLDTWNHVAVTYSTTTGELRVFLNGVQDGMITPNIAIYNNASLLKIGARGDDSDVNSQVTIDEVRLWNIARTEAQIAASMNNCLAGNEPNLVLYYDFENEMVSGVVTDKSPNGNNGNIVTNESPYEDGVFECAAAGIDEKNAVVFSVYPNPTSTVLNIETTETIEQIHIINSYGQIVLIEKSPTFSVEMLPVGIYTIQLQTQKGIFNTRFVKE